MIIEEINIILKSLEIATLVFACLIIFITVLKPSKSQEALTSITGGSFELFETKKIDLFKSIIWIITLILILIFIILIIVIRITLYYLEI